MDKARGTIFRYIYHNEENGYSIALLKTEKGTMTIVGYFPVLSGDFEYDFLGDYIFNPKYGEQFKIESFKRAEIENVEGLIGYLSSNLFTGIGLKTATKIAEILGSDAINLILEDKEVLLDPRIGLNLLRAERLYSQLLENQKSEYILIELYGYNFTPKMAMKLMNKYNLFTLEVLHENPYQLIRDIDGIGFLKADEIAKKVGIADDNPKRLEAAILYTLNTTVHSDGDTYVLKDDLINSTKRVLKMEINLDYTLESLIESGEIINDNNQYYLKNIYDIENGIALKIKNLVYDNSLEYGDYQDLILLTEKVNNIKYTEMQKKAASTALNNNISIITGGPGTGKTTIINLILDLYKVSNNIKDNDPYITSKIALAAPTGRAAKRMKEVLDFESRTVHSLLGYSFDGEFKFNKENPLPHDLIIVDEFSMVDIYLANRLFDAIKPNAKLIIVGDVDQLPSVGPGQILYDLISSNLIQTIKLDTIHRQSKESKIISLAHKINKQILNYDDLVSNDELSIIRSKQMDIKDIILNLVKQALDLGLSIYEDIQILIPQYKGSIGIDKVNELLQAEFVDLNSLNMSHGDRKYFIGDKVIQLVNDANHQIMNGDIGVVKNISFDKDNSQFMVVKYDNIEVTYYKSDLEDINLAYAVSIHKSQGSEYMFVIIPVEPSYRFMLKKELIYTAVTRSRKYLSLVGDANLLIYASNNLSEKRKTSLARRLA